MRRSGQSLSWVLPDLVVLCFLALPDFLAKYDPSWANMTFLSGLLSTSETSEAEGSCIHGRFMLGSCAFVSKTWIEVSGSSAKDVSLS